MYLLQRLEEAAPTNTATQYAISSSEIQIQNTWKGLDFGQKFNYFT